MHIITRGVKTFPTKTSGDIGMVNCVSDATGSWIEKQNGGKLSRDKCETLVLKEAGDLQATIPQRCSALTSCLLCHVHFVLVIPLRWVGNNSNQKHTALYNSGIRARRPFASIAMANGVLPKKRITKEPKSVIFGLPRGAFKYTKECNPLNAVQYCGKIFPYPSLFVSYDGKKRIRRKR